MSEQLWVVRAGRDAIFIQEFLEKKIVAVGWARLGDLAEVHGRDSFSGLVKKLYPEFTVTQAIVSAGQIYRFRDELTSGKYVITYDPALRQYHLGQIVGEYIFEAKNNEHCRHTRAVAWKRTIHRDDLSAPTKNSLGGIATIFCVSQEAATEIFANSGMAISALSESLAPEADPPESELEVRKDTEQRAQEFLQDKLNALGWEEMQELVAGLLRAMGYKTKISPVGPDRGKDIVASPDGFGFQSPRIFVEVKHRGGRIGAPAIRSFTGVLRANDNGLFVSTGGFTQEARYEAERSNYPITLMDAKDLADAIVEHYDRMDIEARALIPLKKIYWPV